MRSVLTIGGSDSCGGAGIQADLKTFLALGVHGASVLTAVTAQNTREIREIFPLPPEFVRQQIRSVLSDLEVEWAKVGMLYSAEIVRAVEEETGGLRLVIDPVMTATTGARLLQESALPELKKLLKRAEVVTPNIPEAEILAGVKIRDERGMVRAAERIAELGARSVVVKGGHLKGRWACDLLYTREKVVKLRRRKMSGEAHGTGCSFSAALTAHLAMGLEVEEATRLAGDFVHEGLAFPLQVGEGKIPGFPSLERARAVEMVYAAAKRFVSAPQSARLIPEVGTNLVMALPWARDPSQVVGLSGRIIRVGGKPTLTGFPELGGSKHMATALLTVMEKNPQTQAAMNVRYWEGVEKACRKLGLAAGEFKRKEEPKGVMSMRWGMLKAMEKTAAPQVIFDRGGPGKEAMVRIFGRDPFEVVELALKLGREAPNGED